MQNYERILRWGFFFSFDLFFLLFIFLILINSILVCVYYVGVKRIFYFFCSFFSLISKNFGVCLWSFQQQQYFRWKKTLKSFFLSLSLSRSCVIIIYRCQKQNQSHQMSTIVPMRNHPVEYDFCWSLGSYRSLLALTYHSMRAQLYLFPCYSHYRWPDCHLFKFKNKLKTFHWNSSVKYGEKKTIFNKSQNISQ